MATRNRELLIGAVSWRSGVKVETIRHYEKTGLLPPPARTANRPRACEFVTNHSIRTGDFVPENAHEERFRLSAERDPFLSRSRLINARTAFSGATS